MTKQSTYDIQQAAYAWLDAIEASDGEVSDDAQTQLDIILGDAQAKATALFYARQRCRSMQAEAKEMAAIATVQKAKWKGHEMRVLGLLRNLLEAKQATGEKPQIAGHWGAAHLHKTKTLKIEDEELIGLEWHKEKTTTSIDTVAIKAALKAGQDVEGCKMVEQVSATIRSK